MTSADSSTSNSPRTSISSFSLGGLLSGNANFSEAAAKGSIIQRLSPLIPIIASPLADKHCQQFGLKTFADFLLPFGKSNDGKVTVRDSQGLSQVLDRFPIRFCSASDIVSSLQASSILQTVDSYIGRLLKGSIWKDELETLKEIASSQDLNELINEDLATVTPWYAKYSEILLRPIRIVDHETFDHPLACVLVAHYADDHVTELLSSLYGQLESQLSTMEYVDPNILKYFILIGDESSAESKQRSADTFAIMKKTFGLHCHMLLLDQPSDSGLDIWSQHLDVDSDLTAGAAESMSSQPTSSADGFEEPPIDTHRYELFPWGSSALPDVLPSTEEPVTVSRAPSNRNVRSISQVNIDKTRAAVREMTVQSIIPFVERNINHLNDQVASARRGLTGRLFSVGRRYLNQRSPNPSQSALQSPSRGPASYAYTSPEGQMRRLADYAFMLQDYRLAHTIYDTLRRDFASERAQVHQAAALCMQAMASILTNSSSRSDGVQLQTQGAELFSRIGNHYASVRSTLLFVDALRYRGSHALIPASTAQMISTKHPVRSALLLEQNAFSYLKQERPSLRKFSLMQAFAGHYYEIAGQIENAQVCSLFATTFTRFSWSRAFTYLAMARTRQAWVKGDKSIAIASLKESLMKNPSQVDRTRLLSALHQATESATPSDTLLTFDKPLLQATKYIVDDDTADTKVDASWRSLEDAFLSVGFSVDRAMTRKAPLFLHKQETGLSCSVGDTLGITFDICNPFEKSISISHLTLQCQYEGSAATSSGPQSSEGNVSVQVQTLEPFECAPLTVRNVTIDVEAHSQGTITVQGISYTINETIKFLEVTNDPNKLRIKVEAPAPSLKFSLISNPIDQLRSGQIVSTELKIENCGQIALHDLRVMTDSPPFVRIKPEALKKSSPSILLADSQIVDVLENVDSVLDVKATQVLPLQIRGDRIGDYVLRFLFVFQSQDDKGSSKYLTSRFELPLKVVPSLKINAFTRPKHATQEEFILGLDIENLSGLETIEVCDIVARSPTWEFSSHEGGIESRKSLSQIEPMQSAFVYQTTRRVQEERDFTSMDRLTSARMLSFLTGQRPPDASPLSRAVLYTTSVTRASIDDGMISFMGASKDSFVRQNLASHWDMIEERQWRDIFTSYQSGDLDLAVIWRTQSSVGAHFIFGIRLGASSPFEHLDISLLRRSKVMYAESERERALLLAAITRSLSNKRESALQVSMQPGHEQNLDTKPIISTVGLRMRTGTVADGVEYNIEVGSGPDTPRSMASDDATHWLGRVKYAGKLTHTETAEKKLQLTALRAGIYDINQWKASYYMPAENSKQTEQLPQLQQPVSMQLVNIQ